MSPADNGLSPALPYLEKINQEILKALLELSPVSGEDLASRLGISRTAVWKHMAQLRKGGLPIEARTGRGYRLVSIPDLLLPVLISRHLTTRVLGRSIHSFSEIDLPISAAGNSRNRAPRKGPWW